MAKSGAAAVRPLQLQCAVRCLGRRAAMVGAATVLAMGGLVAEAATLATSRLYLQSGADASDNQVTLGPVAAPLSGTSAHENTWTTSYGTSSYSAESNASVVFLGTGIGSVSVDAQAHAEGYGARAAATGGATFNGAFDLIETADAPFEPGTIPVEFIASGHAEIGGSGPSSPTGAGRFYASAALQGVSGFPTDLFRIQYEGEGHSDSFSRGVTLYLAPSSTGASYGVQLSATVSAFAYSLPGEENYSQAAGFVDPVIRFDQAAFDLEYGDRSFKLADHYSLVFSPNLAVPEPAPWMLLAAGIGAIAAARQRRAGRESRTNVPT